jgi:glutamyl/glutaminyl-tRNA synthetase
VIGVVSIDDYLANGYLPKALINYMAKLGWNDGTQQEIYSLEELEEKFSMDRVQKAGAIFDIKQLDFLNSHYIKKLSKAEFATKAITLLRKAEIISTDMSDELIIPYIKDEQNRIKNFSEIIENTSFYFSKELEYSSELLCGKKFSIEQARFALKNLVEYLATLHESDYKANILKPFLIEIIKSWGKKNGEILYPMRAALSGKERSPSALEIAEILGKEQTIKRLKKALEML